MHALPNLPASIAREVFAALCASLPAPAADTPEARGGRDDAAMAAVAALHPAAMERAGYWFRDSVPEPVPPDAFDALSEADQYATLYPDRAARIRAAGGLPARLDFGPPAPEIVAALVDGDSPILRALDRQAVGAAAG